MIWGSAKNNNGNKLPRQSKFSASSRLDGKLFGSETIIIEGKVKGEILVKGSLEITQIAEIIGTIKADKLSVHGKVTGNIDVTDGLSVGKIAIIHGDIKAGMVTIMPGAIINGQCSFRGTSDNREEDHILEQHSVALTKAY